MNMLDEFRKLYPQIPDDRVREAKDNLDAYLVLVWEILQERMSSDAPIDDDEEDR